MSNWKISWLLLAISTISIFSNVARASTSAQCPGIDQRSLLLELRNGLVFSASYSSKLVQWDPSADSWSGVMCEDGLVVGLDLSKESISSGINGSSSLFRLESLESLNLAFNDFDFMEIPSAFANLSRLIYLNLSSAGFAGRIPTELSCLTKLSTLDLSDFTPFDPPLLKSEKLSLRTLLGNLSELRELYLDNVALFAEGTEWCDALSSSVPKLEVLSMSDCSLSGPINASLMSLANLSVIQLNYNNLFTTVPSFLANFSRLKTLSLRDCGLQGEFPQEVFQIQTLQTLDVSYNELLWVPLPNFQEDSSLKTLLLGYTNISGRLPDSIGNLRKLTTLDISGCNLSGSIPSSMENLSELTHLDLSLNNLTGSIPTSIGNLKRLTTLWLVSCGLNGSILSSMGNMSELTFLSLSGNHLTGSIPSFGASKNLTRIYLDGNALTGQITSVGWENLLNLKYLHLWGNSLEGDIPPSLFVLPQLEEILLQQNRFSGQLIIYPNVSSHQLQVLRLDGNQLQGSIPASIFKLQELRDLSLSFNNFSGSMDITQFQGFRNLTYLDLSYSGLSINAMVSASAASSPFPDLEELRLASCQLSIVPQFLANQSQLFYLDLSHNCIHREIPQWIWKLQDLTYLNLSSNFFEGFGTLPSNLTFDLFVLDLHSNMLQGNMIFLPTSATYLDFSNNSFHGSIPKSLCEYDYSYSLEVLDFSHNYLNGTIPNCLMLAPLKVLNLRNNQLSGNIPRNISTQCDLRTLDISDNFLQGPIPLSLANCTMLEIVNIGENQIEGTFPCHLMAIPTLRILVLRSNKLHGEIRCRQSHNTWQKLQIIDLSSNDFGGMLPVSLLTSWEAMKTNVGFNHLQCKLIWGLYYQDTVVLTFKNHQQFELVTILTIFTSIDFSNNRFEGPIPDTIGDLKALYLLNLSHNAISGSITPVLGNLHQLESLDLSRNELNGTIPAQLANLDFLSVLNLSNNQLMGSIPENGHLLTFPDSSFEGNLGLCGLQLNKSCLVAPYGTNDTNVDDKNNNSEVMWFYMGIPLGFVVGFWAFCGPLAFIKSWRFAYYRFWDKVLFKHLQS